MLLLALLANPAGAALPTEPGSHDGPAREYVADIEILNIAPEVELAAVLVSGSGLGGEVELTVQSEIARDPTWRNLPSMDQEVKLKRPEFHESEYPGVFSPML